MHKEGEYVIWHTNIAGSSKVIQKYIQMKIFVHFVNNKMKIVYLKNTNY